RREMQHRDISGRHPMEDERARWMQGRGEDRGERDRGEWRGRDEQHDWFGGGYEGRREQGMRMQSEDAGRDRFRTERGQGMRGGSHESSWHGGGYQGDRDRYQGGDRYQQQGDRYQGDRHQGDRYQGDRDRIQGGGYQGGGSVYHTGGYGGLGGQDDDYGRSGTRDEGRVRYESSRDDSGRFGDGFRRR
ncbi:MAG: hypothetical protein H0T79_23495, partial [Deltaproteobacteria bacterium]|nr:hypothetical protein [Deltaproteobacteria bacterium]